MNGVKAVLYMDASALIALTDVQLQVVVCDMPRNLPYIGNIFRRIGHHENAFQRLDFRCRSRL